MIHYHVTKFITLFSQERNPIKRGDIVPIQMGTVPVQKARLEVAKWKVHRDSFRKASV